MGVQRGDERAALLASTIANVNRGKGQRSMRLEEFLLYRPRLRQSTEDQITTARGLAASCGGVITTGGNNDR